MPILNSLSNEFGPLKAVVKTSLGSIEYHLNTRGRCFLQGLVKKIDDDVKFSNMAAPVTRVCPRVWKLCSSSFFRNTPFPNRAHFHLSVICNNGLLVSLNKRGVLKDCFPEGAGQVQLPLLLQSGSQTVYCGFDPTADSLHAGNLLAIIGLLHFRNAGHNVIALIGGATAQIGDPSGKTREREALHADVVKQNESGIRESLHRIFANHELYYCSDPKKLGTISVLNNAKWYKGWNVVAFLSDIGRHFRMGTMLSRHSVQSRLKSAEGMSFTEFSYQLFQAYDFYNLHQLYNCKIQLGGRDQLGNLMTGHEFIQK